MSQNKISAVTFADESQVIAGDDKGGIRRWKVKDGEQQGPTMQASGGVLSVVISPNSRWLVTGDRGTQVIVWNAATHEKVLEFADFQHLVWAVDISSDSTRTIAGDGHVAQIFSITSGIRFLPRIRHGWVLAVKFSPDGSLFATASYDSGFRVYSTYNGDLLFDSVQEGSAGLWAVTPLAWSSDGQQLFMASIGKITCFNVSDSSTSEWSIHEAQSKASIASNGRFIACCAGTSISLWDCVSRKRIGSIITHTTQIECIALSPSGGYLACGVDKNIAIHNLKDILSSEYFDHRSHALRSASIRRQLHSSQLPLIQVSDEVLKSWTLDDDPTNTEMLLSEEITSSLSPSYYTLANRALVRAHLEHAAPALEDAKESIQAQPSPIGYIAMAIALLGHGDRENALCTFDVAFHDCEPQDIRFLLLLKSILVFESGNQEEAVARVEHLAVRAKKDDDEEATYLYT